MVLQLGYPSGESSVLKLEKISPNTQVSYNVKDQVEDRPILGYQTSLNLLKYLVKILLAVILAGLRGYPQGQKIAGSRDVCRIISIAEPLSCSYNQGIQ